jgi:hypothetical protein
MTYSHHFKPAYPKEKITFRIDDHVEQKKAFIVKVQPYFPSDEAMEYINKFDDSAIHGVEIHVKCKYDKIEDDDFYLHIKFSPAKSDDFNLAEIEFRQAVSGNNLLGLSRTVTDEIIRHFENYLRVYEASSIYNAVTEKKSGKII